MWNPTWYNNQVHGCVIQLVFSCSIGNSGVSMISQSYHAILPKSTKWWHYRYFIFSAVKPIRQAKTSCASGLLNLTTRKRVYSYTCLLRQYRPVDSRQLGTVLDYVIACASFSRPRAAVTQASTVYAACFYFLTIYDLQDTLTACLSYGSRPREDILYHWHISLA